MSIAHTHIPMLVWLVYRDLVELCFDVIAFIEMLACSFGYGYFEEITAFPYSCIRIHALHQCCESVYA